MPESAEAWYARHAASTLATSRSADDAHTFTLAYNLLQLSQLLVNDLEGRVHRPHRLTLPGFRLLFKLSVLGPTQPNRLADLSDLTRAAVSNLVNTLERDGFVRRDRSGTDRRTVTVELTEQGARTVAAALDQQLHREKEWFAPLSAPEQTQLASLLRRLIADRPTPG